jgi:hypothetical protein
VLPKRIDVGRRSGRLEGLAREGRKGHGRRGPVGRVAVLLEQLERGQRRVDRRHLFVLGRVGRPAEVEGRDERRPAGRGRVRVGLPVGDVDPGADKVPHLLDRRERVVGLDLVRRVAADKVEEDEKAARMLTPAGREAKGKEQGQERRAEAKVSLGSDCSKSRAASRTYSQRFIR